MKTPTNIEIGIVTITAWRTDGTTRRLVRALIEVARQAQAGRAVRL